MSRNLKRSHANEDKTKKQHSRNLLTRLEIKLENNLDIVER